MPFFSLIGPSWYRYRKISIFSFFFLNRDVLAVLQIEAEMEEEAKWTGGNSGAPDDDDDVPTPFKIDELVCVRDDARGGRDGTQYGCQVRLCTGWSTWSRKIFC